MFADALNQMVKTREAPGDYIKNGLLHCGRCHTPKQVLMSLPALTGTDTPQPFPVACECQRAADEKAETERRTALTLPLDAAVSLDVPVGEDEDGTTLGELQEDPAAARALEDVEKRMQQERLHAALRAPKCSRALRAYL